MVKPAFAVNLSDVLTTLAGTAAWNRVNAGLKRRLVTAETPQGHQIERAAVFDAI